MPERGTSRTAYCTGMQDNLTDAKPPQYGRHNAQTYCFSTQTNLEFQFDVIYRYLTALAETSP